ncbi:MAG: cobalamin biosynthesis protein, partial [Alphaproteobacteria bacterium]
VTMLVGGVAGVLATVIALAGGRLAYGWLLETVALASLVGQRASLAAARHVRQAALGGRGLARAYAAVSGRPPARRDDHGIQREAVEDLATGFALRVVAVLFWYLLLGLAGAFVYVAVLETVAALRRGPGPAKLIAAAPAALLEAVAFVPARLAGLIMALASLSVPTTNPWRAFRVLARESHGHSSRLAGWPLAATAGALGLSLAGPWQTATAAGKEPWIGQGGRARAEPADLRRAAWLFAVSCLVTAALVAATGMIAA